MSFQFATKEICKYIIIQVVDYSKSSVNVTCTRSHNISSLTFGVTDLTFPRLRKQDETTRI